VSNSVVFLLIAVGLSILGSLAVWVHGRPRRARGSSVDHFHRGLQALSANGDRQEAQSGVVLRRGDAVEELVEPVIVEEVPAAHAPAPRPSPRPSPRPRPQAPEREGTHPGS
jgi:hypothetical protein